MKQRGERKKELIESPEANRKVGLESKRDISSSEMNRDNRGLNQGRSWENKGAEGSEGGMTRT